MNLSKDNNTSGEIQKDFRKKLKGIYPVEEINSIFLLVIKELFNYSTIDYLLKKREPVDNNRINILNKIITRLITCEPIQYILGHTEFYGLKMYVNKHVLIPRQETEELVELIINDFKNKKNPFFVLDIGTGSGCIAIALKKRLPYCKITAVDVSRRALLVAKKNAANCNVNIQFLFFDILKDANLKSLWKYDVIVSNPPYILHSQKNVLHDNILKYEPQSALFAPEDDPLAFYKKIFIFSKKNLKKKGRIYLEINPVLKDEIITAANYFGFKKTKSEKDLNGKERFIIINTDR